MKQQKDCATSGVLDKLQHGKKRLFGICPHVKVGGGCGAHGNKKCKHMIKK